MQLSTLGEMLSPPRTATYKMIRMINVISFKLKCVPFTYNKSKNSNKNQQETPKLYYGSVQHQRTWYICSIINILIRILCIGVGLWYDFTHPALKLSARVRFYYLSIIWTTSLFYQVIHFLYSRNVFKLTNSFYMLMTKLKQLDELSNRKDVAVLGLTFAMFITTVTGPTRYFGLIVSETHVFALLQTNNWLVTVCFGLIGSLCIFIDWLFIFNSTIPLLVYVNATCHSLKLLKWNPSTNSTNRCFNQVLIIYRSHQLYHSWFIQCTSFVVGATASIGSILMIASLYASLNTISSIQMTLIFSILFCIAFALCKTGMTLATKLTDDSEEFVSSFRRNLFSLRQIQKLQLGASRKLQVQLGSFSIVTRPTFLYLMSEVVVAKVVDLLIMTR